MKRCYGENADYRILTENKKNDAIPEKTNLEQTNIEYSEIARSPQKVVVETPVKNIMREQGTMVSKNKFMTPADPNQPLIIPGAMPSKKRDIPTFLSGLSHEVSKSPS